MTTAASGSRAGAWWAVGLIALLLGVQGVMLASAARTLSPTADEMLHCVGAYRVRFVGDYRIDREDPPGFLWVASMGLTPGAVPTELTGEQWARSRLGADPPDAYLAAVMADPRVDVVGMVRSVRGVFVWVTLLVGAGVAAAAWRLGAELGRTGGSAVAGGAAWVGGARTGGGWGPVAGVVAAGVWAMEPLVLGHGALVKNDVLLAGAVLAAAMALWAVCRRLTWWAVTALVIAAAAAPMAKFSGLLMPAVVVPLVLGIRAVGGTSWAWVRWGAGRSEGASKGGPSDAPASDGATPAAASGGRGALAGAGGVVRSRGGRVLLAAGLTAAVWVSAWGAVWACYGFRFFATPQGRAFDVPLMVQRVEDLDAAGQAAARGEQFPAAPTRPTNPWNAPAFVRAVTGAHHAGLLPEAMCAGLLYTYGSTLHRPAFLLGAYSDIGFAPTYFPVAWAVKSPLTTIAMVAAATAWAAWAAWQMRRRAAGQDRNGPPSTTGGGAGLWPLLPVAGLFVAASLTTRLNIGLRHLMPVYPLAFVVVGVAAAAVWRRWPRVGRGAVVAGLGLLAAESLPHRGEHVQFFNVLAGGSRGGLGLLSDSNLDWGQDLHRLAEWQRENPRERLWLIYFGPMDPRRVGIRAANAPGSWAPSASPPSPPSAGAVLAISATHLQGTYFGSELRDEMAKWRAQKPLAVLGGTIYLYRVP